MHPLDRPVKPSVFENDAFTAFDVVGGREVVVLAKTLRDFAVSDLLLRVSKMQALDAELSSKISLVEKTLATSTETLAESVKTLQSVVDSPGEGSLRAKITTVENTYASKTYAEAKKAEAVEAAASYTDGQISGLAGVYTTLSAFASATGYLEGKYTLKVVAGNVVTGMNVTSSTGGGADVSDITFNAANFKVYNGTTGVAPFQVSGGQVRVNSLVISYSDVSGLGDLATEDSVSYASITGTKPPTSADNTSSALIGGLNINSGGVTFSGTASLQSSNFSSGSAGWKIFGDGSVEFNNAKFRGVVDLNASGVNGGLTMQAGGSFSFPSFSLLTSGTTRLLLSASSLGGSVYVRDSAGNTKVLLSGNNGSVTAVSFNTTP